MQKTTLFENKLNEFSQNVRFDSEFFLAFEIQPIKVAFFLFVKCHFFKTIPGLIRLSKKIAFVQKQKIAVFGKFLLIFKTKRSKRAKSKLLLAYH